MGIKIPYKQNRSSACMVKRHEKRHACRALHKQYSRKVDFNTNKHSQTVRFCIDGIHF